MIIRAMVTPTGVVHRGEVVVDHVSGTRSFVTACGQERPRWWEMTAATTCRRCKRDQPERAA